MGYDEIENNRFPTQRIFNGGPFAPSRIFHRSSANNFYRRKNSTTTFLLQVFLNSTSCRRLECNLGNLVTDAMVHANALLHTGKYWTDAGIAFMQGGGIRASAYVGNISKYDLITIFPFNSTLYKINITGEEIVNALERSVERYDQGHGEFLQMSGIHVVYDLRKAPWHRVKAVRVVCTDCDVPAYTDLNLKKTYGIVITQFTFEGGDGYTMFKVIVL